MQMTVTDLMTHPPLIVREDANIRDAVKILLNDCAPQLDVVDAQGQLIGSIPDYELLKAQMAGEGDRAVTRVLTAAAARIDIDSTTDFAAAVFRRPILSAAGCGRRLRGRPDRPSRRHAVAPNRRDTRTTNGS